jgi:hypothetical protein
MLWSIIQRLREPDDITGPDLLDWSTFAVRDTDCSATIRSPG